MVTGEIDIHIVATSSKVWSEWVAATASDARDLLKQAGVAVAKLCIANDAISATRLPAEVV